MKNNILFVFIISMLLQGCNSFTTDSEIEKAQKEFSESYCKAYLSSDMTAILKMTHPKCISLFKEKGDNSYLTLIQMLRPDSKDKYMYFYECTIEKCIKDTNKEKSKEEIKIESMTITPVERTHQLKVHFMNGNHHIYFYRDLVYEDGKLYLTFPYRTPECEEYIRELYKNIQKRIDEMSNSKDSKSN